MMNARLILVAIFWFIRVYAEPEEEHDNGEDSYPFGQNSTYFERQWNITRDSSLITEAYGENCLLEPQPNKKETEIRSKGPLCELCSRVVALKFPPEEPITMRYAAFLHGLLTFPSTKKDELLIDVVLCSYDPRIGIDRFYLTKSADESTIYVLRNTGTQKSAEAGGYNFKKFKFILESLYTFPQ